VREMTQWREMTKWCASMLCTQFCRFENIVDLKFCYYSPNDADFKVMDYWN